MRNSALAFEIAQARLDYSLPIEERDIDQETREAITDWQQLRDLDDLGRLAEQIEAVILARDALGRPELPGHDEITVEMEGRAIRMVTRGEGGGMGLRAYYMVAAAQMEVWETQCPERVEYADLFEAARMLVEALK